MQPENYGKAGESCGDGQRDCEVSAPPLTGAAPTQERCSTHKGGEDHREPESHPVVEIGPDLRRLAPQSGDQRRRRPQEDHQPEQDGEQDSDHEEDRARHEWLVAHLGRDLPPPVHQQTHRHEDKEPHVEDQHARDAEIDEGVDREVRQHTRPGEEGGIDHEQECCHRKHQIEAAEPVASPLQEHPVGQREGREPGYEGSILHRVPTPVTAPPEGFVGPVTTEHDGRAKRGQSEQHPRHRHLGPFVVALHPQGSDREGKWDAQCGVADEHDRRVDHHPRVLKQRVQPLPVHRNHRRGEPFVESEGILPDQQQEQGKHGQVVDHHHPRLVGPGETHQRQTEQHPPEDPQEEAALLPAPEGGDQVVQRQEVVGVGPNVVQPVVVRDQEVHEETGRHHHCRGHQHVALPRRRAPAVGLTDRQPVGHGGRNAGEKRQPHQDCSWNIGGRRIRFRIRTCGRRPRGPGTWRDTSPTAARPGRRRRRTCRQRRSAQPPRSCPA